MGSEEVACEGVAEPVSRLGLHEPVTPLFASWEAPCVEVARKVESPFGSEAELKAEIGRRRCIVEEIAFESNILSFSTESERRKDKERYCN